MGTKLEKGGMFRSLSQASLSMAPIVSGMTGRKALGQVDTKSQGWELCWGDPGSLSMPLYQLELQIAALWCDSSLWGPSSPLLNAVIPTNKSNYGYSDTPTVSCDAGQAVHSPCAKLSSASSHVPGHAGLLPAHPS